MCFSPEASFSASILLSIIGFQTLKQINHPNQILLALIPWFFALQQFCEGLVWVTIQHEMVHTFLHSFSEIVFLLIAFMIWPIWMPLALGMMEADAARRRWIWGALSVGILFLLFNIVAVPGHPLSVHIVGHSLQYCAYVLPSDLYYYITKVVYLIAVIVPSLASSFPLIWIFGFSVILASAVADYFYYATFSSVWCFMSALLSIIIYFVMKFNCAQAESKKIKK